MAENLRIPAVQYLRMSTEHQQYSLENQSDAIKKYADQHGFDVVRTYLDEARSGVILKQRPGLKELLQDVVTGRHKCRAILVYDVSRWGRFQDTDESAHYEFLCKSAGVPVHYCAETFANDGSFPNLIMKAVKRMMAGEYSRELGVKIVAGQKRLTLLGFKQGGEAGYGLRRMLVSPTGDRKQELAPGERKSIATDRVILVPGPSDEVKIVRDIYRMLIAENRSLSAIARKLNADGVPRAGCLRWDHYAIGQILTNPKYTGCSVFGRTTSRLYTPIRKLPRSEWTVKPGAFEPIIDARTFAEAQNAYGRQHYPRTDKELLDELRRVLVSEGKLSISILKNAPGAPSWGAYRHRFGSLRKAYRKIGYRYPAERDKVDARLRITTLREGLLSRIARAFPGEVSIFRRSGRYRSQLQLSNGLIVSVLLARFFLTEKKKHRWTVDTIRHERPFVTLLARLAKGNRRFLDFYIFPKVEPHGKVAISSTNAWFKKGTRLHNVSAFREIVKQVLVERSVGAM